MERAAMKAVRFHEFGGPEVLKLEDVPVPEPRAGQLRIRVHAVSVNQTLDVGLRRGESGMKLTLPLIPGIDPSGVVDALGPGITDFTVGDRVTSAIFPTVGGGYAEHAVVDAASTVHIPDGLDFAMATAIRRHLPTAFHLMRLAEVQPGETVLIMGAAGALASCLVQLCREAGAIVIAGAGADARVQAAMGLGADYGINYRQQQLTEQVTALTGGKGVPLVFENVGEPELWQQAVACLSPGGRLVTVGTHGGSGIVPLDIRLLYRKRLTLRGGLEEQQAPASERTRALELAAKGTFRMLIDRILPLSHAAEAHRLVEANTVVGKVIIDPTLRE
jgi:NADPH:quinone reductase-like Zn-dependent oxidoreductase